MFFSIINETKNIELAQKLLLANTFWSRFLGLMGSKELKSGEGLLLSPCGSIHTMFMRYSIDAVFLDNGFTVLEVLSDLPPWRIIFPIAGAKKVLELPAGTLEKTGTVKGDRLVFL